MAPKIKKYNMRYNLVGVILLNLSDLRPASCFTPNGRYLPNNLPKTRVRASEENDNTIGIENYWKENSAKWEKTLRIFDVRAAWASGSLNGILPSGSPSRGAPNERLIALPRALELFEADEQKFLVRRRFRNMSVEELRPRWEAIASKRSALRAEGRWTEVVRESERYRAFERSLVEGKVESADASPAFSRAVATILSPALGAAARQRSRADGGMRAAQVELLDSAGATPDERWVTAALLAELETELEDVPVQTAVTGSLFASEEAERDIADAGSGALYGVIGAVFLFSLQQLLAAGFGQ